MEEITLTQMKGHDGEGLLASGGLQDTGRSDRMLHENGMGEGVLHENGLGDGVTEKKEVRGWMKERVPRVRIKLRLLGLRVC